MNTNEKIIVDCYDARVCEGSYEKGESLECCNSWTHADLPVAGRFANVREALQAVCKANCLDFTEDWLNWFKENGDEPGRFDADFLVDDGNLDASESEKELWKKGERILYNLHLTVWLKVRADERDLTADELTLDAA